MGHDDNVDDALERKVEGRAGTVAVARRGKAGDTLGLKSGDNLADTGLGVLDVIAGEPGREVKLASFQDVRSDDVLEERGHDCLDAVGRKTICDELGDGVR